MLVIHFFILTNKEHKMKDKQGNRIMNQIAYIKGDMAKIGKLMNSFVPDSHDYVKSFDEWLDSTRDGVQYHGRWIKASIAIKYAMPDVYERDLEKYTNEKFMQDKLTSPSYSDLVDDWLNLMEEYKALKSQTENEHA